ncbi:MAG TPA: peptidase M6 [Candidatus Aminicenantes bacterium]|nr:peptidase M6 [Candidatus Aminicenantes bacterium]HRY64363.1 peptidase M6 [Candidatus Aminicenantes bacterium]HRZ71276.1 peptidase M6 [Candidatus Aminicenantes bacterium]
MRTHGNHHLAAVAGFCLAGLSLLLLSGAAAPQAAKTAGGQPGPIDPQRVQDQDTMTWADYRPIPGRNWADPSLKPARGFKLAVVGIDFPGQPFVMTMPKGSDPFGNPQIDPVPRDRVPQFFADFWMKPSEYNHGQTINGYWMEQSRGRFGITEVEVYGPYLMPHPIWHYGLNEHRQNDQTPDGSRANGWMEKDCDALWTDAVGKDVRKDFDAVLRLYASYDETGVWQEFGEMKFDTKDDIPAAWGNPNPAKPRWIPTRYVPWTSWLAGSQQWGLSSMRQGENSGTITHELGHFAFDLPDLNNNPYVKPYRRVAAGPWDMMDRGCFNGPGGPHKRWVVPPAQGAFMPAGLMVRNRLENKFIDQSSLLTLGRDILARAGLAVAEVTARAVDPLPGTYTGLVVKFDGSRPGDLTPPDDPATDPLSPGKPDYAYYTVEVVQRIGYDSFTPDNGVLIAKNKATLRGMNGGPNAFNSYIWVIDAHPEDIGLVDYVKPGGEKVMRTVADFRQLNDALFHAGLDSGSRFEWVDEPNRLHFYVVDLRRDADGILVYKLAVRSLDGSGPQMRGAALRPAADRIKAEGDAVPVTFALTNRGGPSALGAGAAFDADLYRLTVSIDGQGWSARLLNGLAAVKAGATEDVTVYVGRGPGASKSAEVTLRAVSESDPTKAATATVRISR